MSDIQRLRSARRFAAAKRAMQQRRTDDEDSFNEKAQLRKLRTEFTQLSNRVRTLEQAAGITPPRGGEQRGGGGGGT